MPGSRVRSLPEHQPELCPPVRRLETLHAHGRGAISGPPLAEEKEGIGGSPDVGARALHLAGRLAEIAGAGHADGPDVGCGHEQAQLIVEVNAVRTGNMADDDLLNDEFWVSVLIKRGPQLSAAQFATVPRTYRFLQVTRLAAPTDDAPWWRFEGTGLFLWSAPAKLLSRLVEDFIARNYDSLTTAVQH